MTVLSKCHSGQSNYLAEFDESRFAPLLQWKHQLDPVFELILTGCVHYSLEQSSGEFRWPVNVTLTPLFGFALSAGSV